MEVITVRPFDILPKEPPLDTVSIRHSGNVLATTSSPSKSFISKDTEQKAPLPISSSTSNSSIYMTESSGSLPALGGCSDSMETKIKDTFVATQTETSVKDGDSQREKEYICDKNSGSEKDMFKEIAFSKTASEDIIETPVTPSSNSENITNGKVIETDDDLKLDKAPSICLATSSFADPLPIVERKQENSNDISPQSSLRSEQSPNMIKHVGVLPKVPTLRTTVRIEHNRQPSGGSNGSGRSSNSEFSFSSEIVQRLMPEEISFRKKSKRKHLVFNGHEYILGETLGQGSFAKVREALDCQKNALLAVKIIDRTRLRRIQSSEESILREIELLGRLRHKNIVILISHFYVSNDEKDKLYLLLEYIAGGSLKQLIQASPLKRLPLSQARRICSQILDALEYMHQKGFVHRDLKPDNIMLTPKGNVKLIDFGSSESLFRENSVVLGTNAPGIQPPEVASGRTCFAGTAGDIWAVGVILYIMTIGSEPFKGESVHSLLENIAKCMVSYPNWLDGDLVILLQSILQPEPSQRATIPLIRMHPFMRKRLPQEEPIQPFPLPTLFADEIGEKKHCCSIQ